MRRRSFPGVANCAMVSPRYREAEIGAKIAW